MKVLTHLKLNRIITSLNFEVTMRSCQSKEKIQKTVSYQFHGVSARKQWKKEKMQAMQNANETLEIGGVALWRPRGNQCDCTCTNSISFISGSFSIFR